MAVNNIKISKKDILWSYIAKFIALATSLLVMPFVLRLLSSEEIGMNYLMATVSSIVMLIDFGFGPQFGRIFSYVNSGSQELLKEGVKQTQEGNINYHLLTVLLKTARRVYQRLSFIALLLMLIGGSVYIYIVTDGFVTIKNSFFIWIIYSISVYFNLYYSYYTTLLIGSGMLTESSKAILFSRIVQVVLNISMLYLNFGLFAVVISNLLAPFVQRFYCYKVYFTKELKARINITITNKEIRDTFDTIWYNAKKLGINFLGAYAINKFGMFLVGLYLPLTVVGSYGLLIQVTSILSGISVILTNSYMPQFSNYRVTGQMNELKKLFSFSMIIYWAMMIIGGVVIVFWGNILLNFIKSNTLLPTAPICALYLLILTLEGNHSSFATIITTKNEVPFVKASLVCGTLIGFFTFLSLQFTNFNLWGVVIVQGIVQLSYSNWYWPYWVLRDFNVSLSDFICAGFEYFKDNYYKLSKNKLGI